MSAQIDLLQKTDAIIYLATIDRFRMILLNQFEQEERELGVLR